MNEKDFRKQFSSPDFGRFLLYFEWAPTFSTIFYVYTANKCCLLIVLGIKNS